MKYLLIILNGLFYVFNLHAQGNAAINMEVEGKMLVRDINTLSTFQSLSKNAFIRLATNDDPLRGTSLGYFDDGTDKYFYLDTPEGDFGEFVLDTKRGWVGIGTTSPSRRLHVVNDGGASWFESTTGSAIYATSEQARAIRASSNSKDYPTIEASSSGEVSILGQSYNQQVGVWGASFDNVLSRVIYANGVGVYGSSQNGFGVVGDSRGSSDFWAVHGSYGNSSSRRWKSNIENIEDPLEKVSRLRGVTFDWDEEHGGKHSVGFIAEEVGAVLPEIVWFEENGIDARGMDYSKMTPLLVEVANAMRKEYQELLDIQDQKIQNLEKEIDALKALFSANENTIK